MKRRFSLGFIRIGIVVLVLMGIGLSGCSTPHAARRGSLGEVMEKASDKYEGDRVVEVERERPSPEYHHHPNGQDAYAEVQTDPGDVPPPIPQPPDAHQDHMEQSCWYLGLAGSYGLVENDDFDRMRSVELVLGQTVGSSRDMAIGSFGGAWASVKAMSELDSSIEDGIFILHGMIDWNHFLAGSYTSPNLSPYFILGMGFKYMFWDYENDVYTSDGERISFDTLSGIEIHGGLGMHIPMHEKLNLGVEVIPSVTFWGDVTSQGFSNDVFEPFVDVKMRAVLMFPTASN